MAKFKIGEAELELDIADADERERAEKAIDKVMASQAAIQQQSKTEADGIRAICKTVRDCFDAIFGAGTGEHTVGKKDNLIVALDAFGAFSAELIRQKQENAGRMDSILNQYLPNRATRRIKGKRT